jgi:hypothetical protein
MSRQIASRSFVFGSLLAIGIVSCGRPELAVSIEPNTVTIAPGATVQFQATVRNFRRTAGVHWEWLAILASPELRGTVDPNGRLQGGLYSGVVLVTSDEDPNVSARARVTVYPDLIDFGGPVVPSTRSYAIWWGNRADFAPDVRPSVEAFLSGIDGTRYLGIIDQYMRGAQAHSSFQGSIDASTAPPTTISSLNGICDVLDANNLPPDRDGIYFVFTSTFPSNAPYRAWHGGTACHGTPVLSAYVLNPTSFCDSWRPSPSCNALSCEAQLTVEAVAHELVEAMTDPYPYGSQAWDDRDLKEISDKCAGQQRCVQIGQASFLLEGLYSNAEHGCAWTTGR